MTEITIYDFDECQQCGMCCHTPCDIIPSDIPHLLNHFQMPLQDFFKKYLIALLIASPRYSDEILMMVPVRADTNGNRSSKLIADKDYLNLKGPCIFLKNGKCTINECKPFGGRFLLCSKITGSVSIQLSKSQYFDYWAKNQHLFEQVVPGYMNIYNELKIIFEKMNYIYEKQGKTSEYDQLHEQLGAIISQKLYPLFNGTKPINGYSVLL